MPFGRTITIHRHGEGAIRNWSGAQPIRPHWRLYWNATPGAAVAHAGRLVRLDPTLALLIPPHTPAEQTLEAPFRTLFVHFNLGEPCDRVRGRLFVLPLEPDRREELAADATRMGQAADAASQLALLAWVAGCVARLPAGIWPPRVADRRLLGVLDMIRGEPAKVRPNRELAARAGMSVNAFLRLFRNETGTTPRAYATERRLALAAQRLLDTDETVEAVAERFGFCDRHYFTRLFARRYGLGPAGYRRQPAEKPHPPPGFPQP